MKAEIILKNSTQAREAIKMLERKGIDKSLISISSPSKSQIERLLRLQNKPSNDLSLNTAPSTIGASTFFALLALIAIVFTNGNLPLEVKILTVFLAGSIGAFLTFLVSQFEFSNFRKYKSIEITEEQKMSDKVALEFKVNEKKKADVEKVLSLLDPVEVNFLA